jgi:hypothetical protein
MVGALLDNMVKKNELQGNSIDRKAFTMCNHGLEFLCPSDCQCGFDSQYWYTLCFTSASFVITPT